MIDTVRTNVGGSWASSVPVGWKRTDTCRMMTEDGLTVPMDSVMYQHEKTGLRVGGPSHRPAWVEVSLPRLVHPNNGYLISTEEQMRASVGRLEELAGEVSDLRLEDVRRLDVVWQFEGQASAWVHALGTARIGKVRKEPRVFFGQSAEWVGKSFVARVYDKELEQSGHPGNVVRLEFELKKDSVKNLALAVGSNLRELSWEGLRSTYRTCCGLFPAFKLRDPETPLTVAAFLALLDERHVQIEGVPASSVYLNARSRRTQFRLRSQMSRALATELINVDLSQMVPKDVPWRVVNACAA